jgi:hypothetical protein
LLKLGGADEPRNVEVEPGLFHRTAAFFVAAGAAVSQVPTISQKPTEQKQAGL